MLPVLKRASCFWCFLGHLSLPCRSARKALGLLFEVSGGSRFLLSAPRGACPLPSGIVGFAWLTVRPIFRYRPSHKRFTGFSASFDWWDSFSVQLWECHTIFVLSSFFLSSPSLKRSQLPLKEWICITLIYQSKTKPVLKNSAFQRDLCSQSASSSSCVTSRAYHTSKGLRLPLVAIEILILWATG